MTEVDSGELTGPSALLEGVLERIGDSSGPLAALARAYLHRLPPDVSLTPAESYREILGLYEFIEHRTEPIAVRVFNPTLGTHGFESPGTVVEVHVDDSPFLVDSLAAEIQAYGLQVAWVLHPVIGTERDGSGRLLSVVRATEAESRESVQHYVLDRRLEDPDLPNLRHRLELVLRDVKAAVEDFSPMVARVERMIDLVQAGKGHYPDSEVDEAVAFLEWLVEDNYVFLGYREYQILDLPERPALQTVADSGLGILSDPTKSRSLEPQPLSSLPEELRARFEEGHLLVISKTNRLSTVHRRAKMDYIGVRLLGDEGETVGEARLVGLFTSKAYMESVARIPILRQKLAAVTSSEDLIEGSHDHKAIIALVEGFPKDELFGLPTEDLRRLLMGMLAMQERSQVRLFVRRDLLDRGVRIMVAMPRDRYSPDIGRSLQSLFRKRFEGSSVDYQLALGRSDIARLHFTVWVQDDEQVPDVSMEELDREVMQLTRSWSERVGDVLARRIGSERAGRLVDTWAPRFPAYYTTSTELVVAAGDIERLDQLNRSGRESLVGIQNEGEGREVLTRVALYERGGKRALSELTPALEDMGMTVVEEVPTRLSGPGDIFIHDFGVLGPHRSLVDIEAASDRVARALEAAWAGETESDSLHRLVLTAGLDHHQVAILRAYQTYWRRVNSIFTVRYVNDTLVSHPNVASRLIRLFEMRFDPAQANTGGEDLREEILEQLDAVPSLDEDRILRGFFRLIEATLRTNAYCPGRSCLALKLRSDDVPNMPRPRPHVEVFVLGDDVEGVHLRAGRRARGGIRWSERREDYRTEVLGLMKAQTTKNAIIVPTGAKGGFVLRHTPALSDDVAAIVRSAYEVFIRGLLDITDNLRDGEVIHPPDVRIHDGPDPYLVVAADKGTARFSDLANRIAGEYGFWLDDAFASGGSSGYDHKGLGITARGAWKSLECHLQGDGVDPHEEPFTVVGIGDMSGDVFGNGMLGSKTIQLVAAFDHRHVFIDPTPDSEASYRERQRLFKLPRSSWDDYHRDLISEGGGVYPRSAKNIELSEAARRVLDTDATAVTPAELIRIVLAAPVELLWNGGIGTYVKATGETHDEVGDRVNDPVRVDASELRAKVVVEGGNLGLTQRARIEFARGGGKVNTDFIDNSGGVNTSDREVNLKILLRMAERRGELDRTERDELLASEADNVAAQVLNDSRHQAQLLIREQLVSNEQMDAYEQLMDSLESEGSLMRELEWLPTTAEMGERTENRTGLVTPELAVLVAYAKRSLYEVVLASDVPDSRTLEADLAAYFPGCLSRTFAHLLWDHPLRRELIATIVANDIVNSQGPTFVSRMVARSGAEAAAVISAYHSAREVVGGVERRMAIEGLFETVDLPAWGEMMASYQRLIGTLTRWYLRKGRVGPEAPDVERAAEDLARLEEEAAEWGSLQSRLERTAHIERLKSAGVPADLARRTAATLILAHAADILEVARVTGAARSQVGRVFHRLGRALHLDNLEKVLAHLKLADPWQRWALETIEDDLLAVRSALARQVLDGRGDEPVDEAVDRYLAERGPGVARVVELITSLESGSLTDPAPLMVAVRQIQALA